MKINIDLDAFKGLFLGLALGDALCAPYEGGLTERMVWRLIGRTRKGLRRYTDDTQMSLDVAESICRNNGVDQDDLAQTFAASYKWSRGYGAGTAEMLKRIRHGAHWQKVSRLRHPEGSYGNGAAMRAPIAALAFYDHEEIALAVHKISAITHAHPLAKEGALLIALASSLALSQSPFDRLFHNLQEYCKLKEFQIRLQVAQQWIKTKESVDSQTVVQQLGNGMAALDSCVTALYISSRYIDLSFLSMLEFIIKCSGDTDTIGAMAGAIWGAFNGYDSLYQEKLQTIEGSSKIIALAEELHRGYRVGNLKNSQTSNYSSDSNTQ